MATQRHYIQPSNGTHTAGDYTARVQMVDDDGNLVDFDTQTITTTNDSVDATGTTVPAKATFVAGSDGTNTVALKVDSDGNLQVELLTGSAAIGKLAANSGVDIGDVDVLSIAAGTNLIGKVDHATTGTGSGRKVVTTAGTRVTLASSTAAKWVVITAETDNTGNITVGSAAGVIAALGTREGTPLAAGDSLTLPVDNLADVGLDSTVSGDGVSFTYGT